MEVKTGQSLNIKRDNKTATMCDSEYTMGGITNHNDSCAKEVVDSKSKFDDVEKSRPVSREQKDMAQ